VENRERKDRKKKKRVLNERTGTKKLTKEDITRKAV
jgi:hypothetical protein